MAHTLTPHTAVLCALRKGHAGKCIIVPSPDVPAFNFGHFFGFDEGYMTGYAAGLAASGK